MESDVQYRFPKNPALDHILSQMNTIQALTPSFFKINFKSPTYARVSQVLSSLQAFRLKFCTNLSSAP
jgi:hypothetical protein